MSAGDIAGTMALGVLVAVMLVLLPFLHIAIEDQAPWWRRMTTRARVALCATVLIAWPVTITVVVMWVVWIVARNIVGAFRELWRAFFPRPDRADLPRAEVRK